MFFLCNFIPQLISVFIWWNFLCHHLKKFEICPLKRLMKLAIFLSTISQNSRFYSMTRWWYSVFYSPIVQWNSLFYSMIICQNSLITSALIICKFFTWLISKCLVKFTFISCDHWWNLQFFPQFTDRFFFFLVRQ